MFKELKADIPGFEIPNHGTLSGWARQGVLLLNACLTVEKSKANSHKGKGWEKFTVRKFSLFFLNFIFSIFRMLLFNISMIVQRTLFSYFGVEMLKIKVHELIR